jgi:hypothetical protein
LDHEVVRDAILERGTASSFGFGRGIAVCRTFSYTARRRFDKPGNVYQHQDIMLSIAQYRRGLHRAGNLIAGK